jgi:hypothetical protein
LKPKRDPGVIGGVILKWSIKKFDMQMWTRFIWLSMGLSGRLLWILS